MPVLTILRSRLRPAPRCRESGMATAEYALVAVSACAFAATLYLILTSSAVRDVLTQLVIDALRAGS